MIYDTIANLWDAAGTHPMPVLSSSGMAILVTMKANNGWFYAKVLKLYPDESGFYYIFNDQDTLVIGSQAIWAIL